MTRGGPEDVSGIYCSHGGFRPARAHGAAFSDVVHGLRGGILAVYRQATDDAAKELGIRVRYVEFGKPDALPGVFAEMVKERDTALLIWDDPRVDQVAGQILDLAVKHRIPTIVDNVQWAKISALMAYGPKADDSYTGKRRRTWIAS